MTGLLGWSVRISDFEKLGPHVIIFKLRSKENKMYKVVEEKNLQEGN